MIEKLIEQDGVKYARNLGWLVYKAASPGNTGVHDRIHHKNGVTFYIEYKSQGKKASIKQLKFAQELGTAGIASRCCDSPFKARSFIDAMDGLARDYSARKCYKEIFNGIASFTE